MQAGRSAILYTTRVPVPVCVLVRTAACLSRRHLIDMKGCVDDVLCTCFNDHSVELFESSSCSESYMLLKSLPKNNFI